MFEGRSILKSRLHRRQKTIMTWELYSRETLRIHLLLRFLLYFHLATVVGANGDVAHPHTRLTVNAPHLSYMCEVGANVTLLCAQKGAKLHPSDHLHQSWLFTPHSAEHCHDKVHPREHNHRGNHSSAALPWGVKYGASEESFWVQLQLVNNSDQGRYCCLSLDINNGKVVQRTHSHIFLTITPRKRDEAKCTLLDIKPAEVSSGSVTAGLATAACIMAILSLPIIMVLVYKQRQSAQSSQRAHELVRMDSEAAGHENPVFLGVSPPGQAKTRTVSQIMTRQSSETGRHLLLSDPGTPLSPPAHGVVFFPEQDPILESPDFLHV
ncbi:V-type immunoglobulin domain-containing suppressor of T-cell activation isoform X1 [Oncorhynchus mykiss]|uniref:V-set immunoregulatory receptor n=1 Tax=Oncorhynchus mykiss TaxID=8022 RepID=A0A8C7LL12_ONCMY|nr:V-type immunoglobulin domain-containing suppressor of T-cell activation isoform X1 [Oncorhynchus mykiss]